MSRFDKLNQFVKPLMLEASHIAMKHYRNLGEVEYKEDDSPLTQADLEIDRLIFRELNNAFPEIAIITEERADSHRSLPEDASYFLVDPIDGTKEFINRRDEFTVNIGLIEQGKPVFGAVGVPAKGELYLGDIDSGATIVSFNLDQNSYGEPQQLTPQVPDNDALKVVASRSHLSAETQNFINLNKVADTVNAGSSLKFCLLASGAADLYPRYGPTMEWDTAAGHAVLSAAGGYVEDLSRNPLKYGKANLTNGVFLAYTPGVEFKLPE